MYSHRMNPLAALSLCGCLTACAPAPGRPAPAPLLTAEASYGAVSFKLTNTSGRPLLYWGDLCGLNIGLTFLDGTPAPRTSAPGTWCNLRGNLQPRVLAVDDFLLARKDWGLNAGTSLLNVSVEIDVALDRRSDAQRRLHGTPPPDSGCRGLPCPPRYGYGMAPGDPLGPMNMPRQKLRLSAPPVAVTVP